MKYTMNVKINPYIHHIAIEGIATDIDYEDLEQIYLNENFEIVYLKNENGDINYKFNKTGERPPFDNVSRPIEIKQPIENLYFSYGGKIEDVIKNVNQINSEIIELACYAGWYPRIYNLGENFEFDIKIEIP